MEVDCSARDERVLPQTFVDYEENPREYMLSAVNTVLDVHTRVSDLYSSPYNQISEQLRLTIETIKERQESELINNKEYGLLHNVAAKQQIKTRTGAPTPDDLDELMSQGLEGAGVLPGPSRAPSRRSAANAPGAACRRRRSRSSARSSSPGAASRWSRRTRCRSTAEQDQHPAPAHGREAAGRGRPLPAGPARRAEPGLSVRFMGINHKAIASYLISLYCSLAVLTDDALAVLEDVEVDKYHEYK